MLTWLKLAVLASLFVFASASAHANGAYAHKLGPGQEPCFDKRVGAPTVNLDVSATVSHDPAPGKRQRRASSTRTRRRMM